jgi:hypothetical protein
MTTRFLLRGAGHLVNKDKDIAYTHTCAALNPNLSTPGQQGQSQCVHAHVLCPTPYTLQASSRRP